MSPPEDRTECDWALRELLEPLDGPSTPEAVERLQVHLAACARCRLARARADGLEGAMQLDPFPPVPVSLKWRVRGMLRRRRVLRRLAVGTAAAVLLAAGVLAWHLLSGPSAGPVPVAPRGSSPAAWVEELEESAVLVAAPPVDGLDVLARQQAAFVTLLQQLE